MDIGSFHRVYFLGIGGIGMSALARYFSAQGAMVGGYDLTATGLTRQLESMGMEIHYNDNPELIPQAFRELGKTLVVLTPAVPENHLEWKFFKDRGFTILKRAQVLGQIFNSQTGIAIAGTHGKTSVTTFTSFLLNETGIGCNAFLGGISKNFNSNLVLNKSEYVVAEADEFDRSFLQLFPHFLLITTVDADHLDIYSGLEEIQHTFQLLVNQVRQGGTVVLNNKVKLKVPEGLSHFTYSLDDALSDFYASNIRKEKGAYCFTLHTPFFRVQNLQLEVPGKTNIENAIAAMAVSCVLGATPDKLIGALPRMRGVVRRFDVQYQSEKVVYIDDYAHHPRELDAVISSLRDWFPGKKITAVFQPHLFSRTRDFATEFAESLSKVDELILMDIYPAREKPIPGVTSDIIFNRVRLEAKHRCSKINLLSTLKELNIEVLLTAGAGDIDQFITEISHYLAENEKV